MKFIDCLVLALVSVLLCSCAAKKPYYRIARQAEVLQESPIPFSEADIEHEVFLVGGFNAGFDYLSQSVVLQAIKQNLKPGQNDQSIVFLGDILGDAGIPEEGSDSYIQFIEETGNTLSELINQTNNLYIIPGNHEWYDGKTHSVKSIQEFQELFESLAGGKNIVKPRNGCGEPHVIELADHMVLVLVDSQWLIQGDNTDERKRSSCDIDNELDFITELDNILADYKTSNIIIATHHPIYSNSTTGGNYPASSHFIPAPLVGTVITGAKILINSSQKFGHPNYEAYRAAITTPLSNYRGISVVSAHDKNLQYFTKGGNHFITSGSGQESNYVRKGGHAEFAIMQTGYVKLTQTKNHELWLEMYSVNKAPESSPKRLFIRKLNQAPVDEQKQGYTTEANDSFPVFVHANPSNQYAKPKLGMGAMYRNEWGTEVQFPVILLDTVDGGLIPVKQGGGFQTRSLRLENPDGRQYVLRSIEKDATKSIPEPLRNTFAQGLIQDGIAATHPFGALAIPTLAEAIGIYHSNPRIVWLPAQQALSEYNAEFADQLYLFEERPGGNMEGHPTFGGATKTIATLELIPQLAKSHKHRVDQEAFLKARIFDILIGDWDRHEDQWRWGIHEHPENNDRKIYRAIPRDRDQVFFKNDGFMNYLVSRSWFNPKLQKFDHEIKNLPGLIKSGRHMDRIFLNQLSKEEFVRAARQIQEDLDDATIESAFEIWPKEIFDINGPQIISLLKQRRDDLQRYALEFYFHISKEVTVTGTDDLNRFDLEFKADNQVAVQVFHADKEGEYHLIWNRLIHGSETEELRLFGLKKKDEFRIKGNHPSTIKIRIIGGGGKDVVINESNNESIIIYDKQEGMSFSGNPIKSKLADRRGINTYDRTEWELNRQFHFPMVSFYTDEGIGLSYNIWWTQYGFRSDPYQSNHALKFGYYFQNSAIVGTYTGHWPNAAGPGWDLHLNASGKGPTFTQYFYGLGNEYVDFSELFPEEEDASSTEFHIVKGIQLNIKPSFARNLGNGNSIFLSTEFEFLNINNTPGSDPQYIYTDKAGLTPGDFESKYYGSIGLQYQSKRLDNELIPNRGYHFTCGIDIRQNLRNSDFSHIRLQTNASFYIPLAPTQNLVIASNFGGAYSFGDYEFFHANYLSSSARLRGFKTNRFGGDGIVYHATDLRIKLSQGKGPFRTGLGIFGAFDYGRAFLDDEDINSWQVSYGGGLYFTPLNLVGFKIGYFIGEQDKQLSIGGALSF